MAQRPRHEPDVLAGNRKGERIGVFLDLENLSSAYRRAGDWSGAARALGKLLESYSRRGKLVVRLAVCDRRLARDLGPKLERYGVVTVPHNGGAGEADRRLLKLVRSFARGCGTIVIGSGDRFFATEASKLRRDGKHVEAVAHRRMISAELYVSVDDFREFPPRP